MSKWNQNNGSKSNGNQIGVNVSEMNRIVCCGNNLLRSLAKENKVEACRQVQRWFDDFPNTSEFNSFIRWPSRTRRVSVLTPSILKRLWFWRGECAPWETINSHDNQKKQSHSNRTTHSNNICNHTSVETEPLWWGSQAIWSNRSKDNSKELNHSRI